MGKLTSTTLTREVRAALRALHDVEAFARRPLAAALASTGGSNGERSPGSSLQEALLTAIDELRGTSKGDRRVAS